MDNIKELNEQAFTEIGVYNLIINKLNKEEAILTTVKQLQADVEKLSARIEGLDGLVDQIKEIVKTQKVTPQDELKAKMVIAKAKDRAAQLKKIQKRVSKLRQ